MFQPRMWSLATYAPNLGYVPCDPPDGISTDFPPSSSVHPQESDQQEDLSGWQGNPLPSDPGWEPQGQLSMSCTQQNLATLNSDCIVFRHSGWAATRARVATALSDSDAPESRVKAFSECGRNAYLVQSLDDPAVHKITSSKCKDRFCKPCARERAGSVARCLLEHVGDRELRFITLTLKTQTTDLTIELNRLYLSFQTLRRRMFWKRHVIGGAALLEVKYNDESERWHPHLHILVEGRYVPHTHLVREWKHVTGDSFIVDIRAVKDNSRVTRYITKYATDPIDRSIGRSIPRLVAAIDAFRGRKTCLTFGTWRGVLLSENDDRKGWRHISSLNQLISDARDGILNAVRILNALWVYQEATEKNARNPDGRSSPPPDALLFPA